MIKPQTIRVLGTKIHMAEIDDVCSYMETILEIEPGISHHFVNTGMHGLMEAYRDPEIRRIFEAVEMFAPDGILVVLLAKLRGFRIKKENTGPNLLWEFSRRSNIRGYKHYFYGDISGSGALFGNGLIIDSSTNMLSTEIIIVFSKL